MDLIQIASNIISARHLQLLIEAIQRVECIRSEAGKVPLAIASAPQPRCSASNATS